MPDLSVTIHLAPKLEHVFLGQARYRVAYGGRGSGKSWGFARMALLKMLQNPGQPFFFGRELQNSIKDSVHKLLTDQARAMGLSTLFDVGVDYFRCKNGAYAIFKGLRTNADAIKSLEGVKYAWIEEAHKLSANSLELLKPTIRAAGSEIWFTFNPETEDDAVYQMFVANEAPSNALVQKINWDDNPWFPAELEEERALMAQNDLDMYEYVWGGNVRKFAGGAIYGKQMVAAKEGTPCRIALVPYDPKVPVITAWDLGYSDTTSIGFFQVVGKEPRCIDYYQNNLEAIDHYVRLLKSKPYLYDVHVLPHDAGHKSLRTGTTLAAQLATMGLGRVGKDIEVLPVDSVETGIELVRQLLPQMWFSEANTKELVKALLHYQYEYDDDHKVFKNRPLHNWASHCFTGDTKVLTRSGTYQIKDLPNQGEVLTPCGWKLYRNPRVTRSNAPLVEVVFKGGYTVKCTPEHMFLTVSGWKSANSLMQGSQIQSTLTRSHVISMAVSTACGRVKRTLPLRVRKPIVKFGRLLLGLSQQVVTFITATKTHYITPFTTLNVSPLMNTYAKLYATAGLEGMCLSSIRLRGIKLTHGTGPKKGSCGTAAWQPVRKAGRSGSGLYSTVLIALKNLKAWFAAMVGNKSSATQTAKPLIIETVRPLPYQADVWCLTVPSVACFSLANGAVVHNCADMLRYMATYLARKKGPVVSNHLPAYAPTYGTNQWMG